MEKQLCVPLLNTGSHPCFRCGNLKGTKKCSRCKVTLYCSKDYQTADWPTHKERCKLRATVSVKSTEHSWVEAHHGQKLITAELMPIMAI